MPAPQHNTLTFWLPPIMNCESSFHVHWSDETQFGMSEDDGFDDALNTAVLQAPQRVAELTVPTHFVCHDKAIVGIVCNDFCGEMVCKH